MTPSEAIALIILIVRTRTLSTRWPEAVEAVTTLIVYALKEFGPKPETFGAVAPPTADELKECRATLEGVQDDLGAYGSVEGEDAQAVDPVMVAMLIKFAIELVTALINRKKD